MASCCCVNLVIFENKNVNINYDRIVCHPDGAADGAACVLNKTIATGCKPLDECVEKIYLKDEELYLA